MIRRCAALLAVAVIAALLGIPSAAAARTTGWATWGPITGSSNDYATTMQLPAKGFPKATVATDSRANVQLPSGDSTFVPETTAVGAKYGSSKGNSYLNLRPKADNASSPSTTTYTFDHPTPETGWTFVLGDIDSDQVQISATGEDGTPLTATQINEWKTGHEVFNYTSGGTDLPSWDAATSTLTGNDAAADTNGASGWFEPNVRLTSLTFTFTRRAGFPVYQTWFASIARDISGTITDTSSGTDGPCPVDGTTLRLISPAGEELATTPAAADGTYRFSGYATQAGYTVEVVPKDGCAVVGASRKAVDNTGEDDSSPSIADFNVRKIIPQPVSGTVTDSKGAPVAGVTITLTAPGGETKTATTDSNGKYLFDDNVELDGYTAAVTDTPDGYGTPAANTFDITPGEPAPPQDFVLPVQPSVSGKVIGGGNGLGGVPVTLTPAGGGPPLTTVTKGDGTYTFERVPAGTYSIGIETPDGYATEPSLNGVTVNTADVPNQDFDLTRPGSIAGQVTNTSDDPGTPVEGASVTIDDGPGGEPTRTIKTDADGNFFLDGLPAGTYEITVTVPDGFKAVGPTKRTVEITAEGEIRGGENFAIERVAATPTPTPTTPTPTEPAPTVPSSAPTVPSSAPSSSDLPDTGADVNGQLVAGSLFLLAGVLVLGGAAVTRRVRRAR